MKVKIHKTIQYYYKKSNLGPVGVPLSHITNMQEKSYLQLIAFLFQLDTTSTRRADPSLATFVPTIFIYMTNLHLKVRGDPKLYLIGMSPRLVMLATTRSGFRHFKLQIIDFISNQQ